MTKFIFPFLISFCLSVIFMAIGILIGKKIPWAGRESIRHVHKKGSLRIGGAAMVLAFVLSVLLNGDLTLTPGLYGLLAGSFILMIAGFWDDIREIFWKTQLLYQIAVAVFMFIVGIRIYYITNPISGGILKLDSGWGLIFSVVLVIAWIVVMINSMNWLDGIDGLSGGVSLIGSVAIFFLSLKPEVNQPPMAILAVILAGVFSGFLIFNFYPSKVMAGTAGSMFMGFSLSVLAIFAGTKIATSILVMTIPLLDSAWVIGERIKNKKSIFKADRNHLHHKLLDLGWSPKKISFLFYLITFFMAIVALNTRAIGKSITLIAAALVMGVASIYIARKLRRKSHGEAS